MTSFKLEGLDPLGPVLQQNCKCIGASSLPTMLMLQVLVIYLVFSPSKVAAPRRLYSAAAAAPEKKQMPREIASQHEASIIATLHAQYESTCPLIETANFESKYVYVECLPFNIHLAVTEKTIFSCGS